MDVGIVVDPVQRLFHRALHPDLVDVAHVVDVDAVFPHQPLLAIVHRADADLPDLRRQDRRHAAAERGQCLGPDPAQAGDRHAVDVARWGDLVGVEIGVRIQPQHAQVLARLAAMARDRGDRTDAEAVVAAEHDRHPPVREFGIHRIHRRPVPRHHLVEVAVAVMRRQPGVVRASEVAAVDHLHAARGQRLAQPGQAQGFGPHARAAIAGTDVGGNANERDRRITAHATTPGWCRHPGSNWGPTAYKAVALPTELCRRRRHSSQSTLPADGGTGGIDARF